VQQYSIFAPDEVSPMDDAEQKRDRLQELADHRKDRREFFKALATAASFAGGLSYAGSSPLSAQSAISDPDILNFALNLEYLEAQFYAFAVNGTGLANSDLGGSGAQGAVTGGRKVNFTDPIVAQYAREIAADEVAHVKFLRAQLGASAVAQPAIDIGTAPDGAFSSAARAAGLIGAGQSFDPYSSDEFFLLGAFIFEDVGVTAYKGAAPLITNKTYLEAAAGILAVEAYHASIVRTTLYAKGIATPMLRSAAGAISDARDSLAGPSDLDQGISPSGGASNIVPLDRDGIAFSRSPGQVLNIAYLKPNAVDRGGFFPNGVNGNIKMSAAN
jgi:hypothetical protein